MNFDEVISGFPLLMQGLEVSIELAVISIIFSLIIGTILGTLRYLKIPVISQTVTIFIELTRAIPLIMYIVFIHYTISAFVFYNLHLNEILHFKSTQMQSGVLALVLFNSAYVAEIVRSGFNAIDREQIYGAKALGMTNRQIMQYIFIPLSFYRMLPSLLAQFITLIKDTSLVSAIGLIELTRAGEFIYENTHQELEVLLFIGFIYFILCYTLSKIAQKISSKSFLVAMET